MANLVTPDFSEVKDNVGPGTYNVRITGYKLGEWQSGTKFINWEAETFNEEDEKNNGRKIFHRTPIEGKGAFLLQGFYKAAMKEELDGAFDPEMLCGKELSMTVVDGTDKQGNPSGYTEVKTVKPL